MIMQLIFLPFDESATKTISISRRKIKKQTQLSKLEQNKMKITLL